MRCAKCGIVGITYGHIGLCGVCYQKHRQHQFLLQATADEARKMREARKSHPSGKSPRQRARQLWIDMTRADRDGSLEKKGEWWDA